jgi:hypothetical protein
MIIQHVVCIPLNDMVDFVNTTENIKTIRNLLEKYEGYLVNNNEGNDFLDRELSETFEEILFDNSQSKTTMVQKIKTLVNDCNDWYLILKIGCVGDFEMTDSYGYKSYNEDEIIDSLRGYIVEFIEIDKIFKNAQIYIFFEHF